MPKLKNIKHEKFCQAIVLSGNQDEAYRKAGYRDKSRAGASKLTTNHNVKARIEELRQEIEGKYEISKDKVIKELSAVSFSNIKNYITFKKGNKIEIKDINKLPDHLACAIESVKVTENERYDSKGKLADIKRDISFKLYSKLQAVDQLSRILNYYPKQENQTVNNILIRVDNYV